MNDIGLIGLAVMGENLALNIANHGFSISVFNGTTSKVDDFVVGRAQGKPVTGTHMLLEFVGTLKKPRKIIMLVKAGKAEDELIDHLVPLCEPGDILIDGGNSLFSDSIRRAQYVESKGMLFVGSGVSGGEEGALKGPSLMPGGSPPAWKHIKPIFQAICAKTPEGDPCCDWIGENGAGHFVKMVHNGIEYGDMQLIGEVYDVMKRGLGMTNEEMQGICRVIAANSTVLVEITRDILAHKDETARMWSISSSTRQKGAAK
jgi:6-phosphogluconate dehydrogenase